MYKLFLFISLPILLLSKNFTIASYNVENLFDLKYDKTEYEEFIPNKTNWNKEILEKKLNNISKAINDINADIIALQEVESQEAIELLIKKIPQYKYFNFVRNQQSAVGIGILSKYKIVENKSIKIRSNSQRERPIQKVKVELEKGKYITIFNNHWRSKRAPESMRIVYAKSLQEYLKNMPKSEDYVLVGDFNSNYDEFETIKYNKELNDTNNITGINQVLNTTIDDNYIIKETVLNYKNKRVHYNLWLELPYNNRFSYIYRNNYNTPDNIILSPALFDNKNIFYINNSFKVFKPPYLIENKKINRWIINKGYHKGEGYSDHLPIIASFSTTPQKNNFNTNIMQNGKRNISYLYVVNTIIKPIKIENVIVIYKANNSAIVKAKDDRAIYIFNNANSLKIGKSYDLEVKRVKNHFGLTEITQLNILKEYSKKEEDVRSYYIDANRIDLFDLNYQNEIVTKLKGVFQNGYLYYKNTKIKLYSKNKELLPKNGEEVLINSAHLGYFKQSPQLIIYNEDDYSAI